MTEQIYNKLHPTEAITKAMPKIIEAFVAFYGEEERANIENKFQNMLIICYSNPRKIPTIIINTKKQKSLEGIETFLDKINIPKEVRPQAKKLYFDDNGLEFPNDHPIYQYTRYLNGQKSDYIKKSTVDFISQIYPQVNTNNIDTLISSGELSAFNNVIKLYDDMLKTYADFKTQVDSYEEYFKKIQKLRKQLERKYTKTMVEEFHYLFTEKELSAIREKLNSESSSSIRSINSKTECYFGFTFEDSGLIDAFSDEAEEILKENSTWRKQSIIDERIDYFKNNGLDLGDNYGAYLNHRDIMAKMPELRKLAEKIKRRRSQLHNMLLNEFYQSLEEYRQNIAKIKQANLLDRKIEHNMYLIYELAMSFTTTNIKATADGYIMYPILFMSMGNSQEYLDHILIHELNHVYELSLKEVKGNEYYAACGWDQTYGKIDSSNEAETEEDETQRNYELFNEIINEMISSEITQLLFDADGYIFNTKKDSKLKGGTSYDQTYFLVQEFYNTYKKAIIESRKNGDMSIIYNAVGKENFEALNNLFHTFRESFDQVGYHSVMLSIRDGKETAQTKKFDRIIEKRNEILASMAYYHKKNTISL